MRLPEVLRSALDAELAGADRRLLREASAEITAAYKRADFGAPTLKSRIQRLAYALARLPATYAANFHAFSKFRECVPGLAPRTLLDVGAGPGTSAWAAAEIFSGLEKALLLERDAELMKLGRKFAAQSEHQWLRAATWQVEDLNRVSRLPAADLIVISYSLGELHDRVAERIVASAWEAAQQGVIVIEPGTRKGFEVTLKARDKLIGMGATVAAPCPHVERCPMAAAGDWCHFAQRLERTAEHRRMKQGELGYEDEKFSYVAATELPVSKPRARIVRHPQIFSGFVKLQLCSGPVLEQNTVTRSMKSSYKEARHAKWGDRWDR